MRRRPALLHGRAEAGGAGVEPRRRRQMDRAERRHAPVDQRDVDRELAVAGDELAGAVERVDEPEAAPVDGRDLAARGPFLGDDGDVRRQLPERRDDQPLGVLVGVGDGAAVGLGRHREIAAIDGHDLRPRGDGDVANGGEQRLTPAHGKVS